MAHLTCTCFSKCLKMNTTLTVILPEEICLKDAKVLYLLHGLEDDCSGWTRYTAVERYAREYQAVVVTPQVQRSFYTDMEMGLRYFQYVLEEVPELCHKFFDLPQKREQNFIMGLSMGGYGALKCAFHKPKQYAACAAFSPVTDLPDRVRRAAEEEKREFRAIFGAELQVPAKDDLFCLARDTDPEVMPEVYLACGEADDLYSQNVRFAQLLENRGYRMEFEHWEGNHNWIFWDKALARAMEMLWKDA